MVRRASGLFAGFDLRNGNSLRKLAIALEYWLAGGRDDNSVELKKLTQLEQATIGTIALRITNNPLLTQIVTPLLQAPRLGGHCQSPDLLAAGRDLIDYAVPAAEQPRAAAYQDALAAWENRWPLRAPSSILPNHEGIHQQTQRDIAVEEILRTPSRGVVEDDCDTSEGKRAKKNKRKKTSSAQTAADAAYNFALPSTSQQLSDQGATNEEERGRKKSKKNLVAEASAEASNTFTHPPPPPPQRRRSTRMSRAVDYRDSSPETTEKLRELSSEAVDADAEKQIRRDRRLAIMAKYDLPASELPPNYNPGILTPLRDGLSDEEDNTQQGARERRKGKDPRAPRRTKGDKAIDDGTVDFEPAAVGLRDGLKLIADYNTIRPDPNNPGKFIPGDRVKNRYHREVDFNDAESVRKLNAWRHQLFRRCFPEFARPQLRYLESEKQTILGLMKDQMERNSAYLRWNKLTNDYNRQMSEVIQRVGEKLVAAGNRKAHVLAEDRKAPWRTRSAIAGISSKWQEYRNLVDSYTRTVGADGNVEMEYEQETGFVSGDDDYEIPEPSFGAST